MERKWSVRQKEELLILIMNKMKIAAAADHAHKFCLGRNCVGLDAYLIILL